MTSPLDGYDFDWGKYREQILTELTISYEAQLEAADFAATPAKSTHAKAVQMAEKRAGELIKAVTDTTRDAVKAAVADVLEAGGTPREIKNRLRDLPELNDDRAKLIARTEVSFATNRATVEAYKSNGIAKKQWILGTNPEDDECTGLSGEVVAVNDTFSSGDMAPPLHPNCTCGIVGVRE